MAHMQRKSFHFIAESKIVVVLSSFILLAILVTRFEIVELDSSLYSRFLSGDG